MGSFTLISSDIEPLLEGLAILGTGGGGSPAWGRMILEIQLLVDLSARLSVP
jgi:hypothetical protein